jgi:hypothetical protein
MPLKYTLQPLKIGPEKEKQQFRAIAKAQDSVDLDGLIDQMMRMGTTVTRADAVAVILAYHETILNLVADGHNVNTPIFQTKLSIKGVFEHYDSSADPSQHQVRVNLNPGTALRALEASIKVQKVGASLPRPQILQLMHLSGEEHGKPIQAGSILKITGAKLNFDKSDTEQGVFLSSDLNDWSRLGMIFEVKPAEILFQLPALLPPNKYQIQVRCKLRNTTQVRTSADMISFEIV